MPGHIVKGAEAVEECKATISKLEQLIAEHDVVFLLLDSREARWLPTVIATAQSKVRSVSLYIGDSRGLTHFRAACHHDRAWLRQFRRDAPWSAVKRLN